MNKDKYCMMFTNEEIIEYLIKPLKKYSNMRIRMSSADDVEVLENTIEKICFVSFDGERENFSISFYGHQTSIFISDQDLTPQRNYTFNEEFMFIDDNNKQHYTSSDTYKNIVYEGKLKDKEHKEILTMFCEFIVMLNGAKSISVQEEVVSDKGFEYPKCNYIVKIYNESGIEESKSYENILFLINETVL